MRVLPPRMITLPELTLTAQQRLAIDVKGFCSYFMEPDFLINADPDYPAYKARLQGVSVMTEDEFVKTFDKLE